MENAKLSQVEQTDKEMVSILLHHISTKDAEDANEGGSDYGRVWGQFPTCSTWVFKGEQVLSRWRKRLF